MQNAQEASGKLEKDIAEKEALLDAAEARIRQYGGDEKVKRDYRTGLITQAEMDQYTALKNEAEGYRQKLAELYEEQTTVTFAIFDAQKAIEESTAKYNELTGAAKGAAEGLESTADSAERVADNAKESALSLEELKEQLEKTKDAKETLEDSINAVGDAVYEALKNKAQAAYDATVDGIRAMQDAGGDLYKGAARGGYPGFLRRNSGGGGVRQRGLSGFQTGEKRAEGLSALACVLAAALRQEFFKKSFFRAGEMGRAGDLAVFLQGRGGRH